MRLLDLFSGIGGFSLGLERAGMRTVAFCEIDPKCRAVLRHHWPEVPIYEDARSLPRIECDVIAGGFPCQPFSTAARGRNNACDLWPEFLRIVTESRPRWVVAENVPGIGSDGVERVASDLEDAGYTVWPIDMDTAPPGRTRGRRRFFWLAHADSEGEPRRAEHEEMAGLPAIPVSREAHNAPPLGVADVLPGRMDRLRMLGNAVTPLAAEIIGRAIRAADGA
jgi:DNA (cytosine-5)-methyltransferase 1